MTNDRGDIADRIARQRQDQRERRDGQEKNRPEFTRSTQPPSVTNCEAEFKTLWHNGMDPLLAYQPLTEGRIAGMIKIYAVTLSKRCSAVQSPTTRPFSDWLATQTRPRPEFGYWEQVLLATVDRILCEFVTRNPDVSPKIALELLGTHVSDLVHSAKPMPPQSTQSN